MNNHHTDLSKEERNKVTLESSIFLLCTLMLKGKKSRILYSVVNVFLTEVLGRNSETVMYCEIEQISKYIVDNEGMISHCWIKQL